MAPDVMGKLPVTCVRFYPVSVDGNHTAQSHIIAASCKCSSGDFAKNSMLGILIFREIFVLVTCGRLSWLPDTFHYYLVN